MHNFLYQIVWIFPLHIYCLQEESTHFALRALTNFFLKVLKHFVSKNHSRKIDKFTKIFELYRLFILSFCSKMFRYLQIIYRRKVQKAFLPPLPFFFFFHHFPPDFNILLFTNLILIFISKNWFYFFFIIFCQPPILLSCKIPCYRH